MRDRRQKVGWLERRRERKRLERERTGDTPERQSEEARSHQHPEDPVAKASIGGAVNQAATHI
jgi:hypothetical protein